MAPVRTARQALSDIAPAKINLCLHIVGRRTDGYHLLESLVLPIDLCDRLNLRPIPDGELSISCPNHKDLETPDNLVLKAARWYFDFAKIPNSERGFAFDLEKRIPIAAGMGGGSSDAAAALRLLQRHFGSPVKDADILKECWRIGADVPVMFERRARWMSGIGETLGPEVDIAELNILLVNPNFPVSTRWAYENYKKNLHCTRLTNTINGGRKCQRFLDRGSVMGVMYNALESVVMDAHPDLSQIKAELSKLGAGSSLMTGSGPTLFALFETLEAAEEAKGQLETRVPQWGLWVVKNFRMEEC